MVPAPGTPKLQIRDVSVMYFNDRTGTRTHALQDISLDIDEEEFVAIVGPSGCGKGTFPGAVDGLIPIPARRDQDLRRAGHRAGPDRAVVFQQASLRPWRTVMANVIYGLELQGTAHRDAEAANLVHDSILRSLDRSGWIDRPLPEAVRIR